MNAKIQIASHYFINRIQKNKSLFSLSIMIHPKRRKRLITILISKTITCILSTSLSMDFCRVDQTAQCFTVPGIVNTAGEIRLQQSVKDLRSQLKASLLCYCLCGQQQSQGDFLTIVIPGKYAHIKTFFPVCNKQHLYTFLLTYKTPHHFPHDT